MTSPDESLELIERLRALGERYAHWKDGDPDAAIYQGIGDEILVNLPPAIALASASRPASGVTLGPSDLAAAVKDYATLVANEAISDTAGAPAVDYWRTERDKQLQAVLTGIQLERERARQEVLDISAARGGAILGSELAGLHSAMYVMRGQIDAPLTAPATGRGREMTDTLAIRSVAVALCRVSVDCRCQLHGPTPCTYALARKGQEAARLVKEVSGNASRRVGNGPRAALEPSPATRVAKTTGEALPGLCEGLL